jgi:hypothetical protein
MAKKNSDRGMNVLLYRNYERLKQDFPCFYEVLRNGELHKADAKGKVCDKCKPSVCG